MEPADQNQDEPNQGNSGNNGDDQNNNEGHQQQQQRGQRGQQQRGRRGQQRQQQQNDDRGERQQERRGYQGDPRRVSMPQEAFNTIVNALRQPQPTGTQPAQTTIEFTQPLRVQMEGGQQAAAPAAQAEAPPAQQQAQAAAPAQPQAEVRQAAEPVPPPRREQEPAPPRRNGTTAHTRTVIESFNEFDGPEAQHFANITANQLSTGGVDVDVPNERRPHQNGNGNDWYRDWRYWALAVLVIALAILAGLLFTGCQNGRADATAEAKAEAVVQPPQQQKEPSAQTVPSPSRAQNMRASTALVGPDAAIAPRNGKAVVVDSTMLTTNPPRGDIWTLWPEVKGHTQTVDAECIVSGPHRQFVLTIEIAEPVNGRNPSAWCEWRLMTAGDYSAYLRVGGHEIPGSRTQFHVN